MEITKEKSIALVIQTYGKLTRKNIQEMIKDLCFENDEVLNPAHEIDLMYIEANMCVIGYLYSALRSLKVSPSDFPLYLN